MTKASCAQLVHAAPTYFQGAAASDLTANIGLVLAGEDGGEWTFVVSGGQLTVQDGLVQPLAATMRMATNDWICLVQGEIIGTEAFRGGRIVMEGDPQTMRLFGGLFHHSTPGAKG